MRDVSSFDARIFFAAFILAIPFCIGFTQPPSTPFYNMVLAVLAWGTLLAASPVALTKHDLAAILLIALGGMAAIASKAIPVTAATVLLAAALVAVLGYRTQTSGWQTRAVITSLLLAALVNAALAAIQYFAPQWTDGQWIATPTTPGRAVGNLRQPNQLGSLLLLGICALVWWSTQRARAQRLCWAMLFPLTLGVMLTGSRTAILGLAALSLWGAVDRALPTRTRELLLGAAGLAVLHGVALWWVGQVGGPTPFAQARMQSHGDISSSRFGIWANTLELIRQHLSTGVGSGNFNLAWTFTAFPDRPIAFFDHTHNLVLQLAVELGVPATAIILGLLAWMAWRARVGLTSDNFSVSIATKCSAAMLALLLWHSMLEYPLWYPYFLLPTAFALGVYLSIGWPRRVDESLAARSKTAPALYALVGLLMIAGALYAIWDYQRVVQIFAPYGAKGERPLPERIAEGQKSWLFGHHADYAAVTTASRPSEVFSSFERPLKHLVDARLMIAYAKALNELGHRDEAIYVVQRLREFRHPLGEEFLRRCADPLYAQTAFECDTRPRSFTYEDLRVEHLLTGRAPTSATR